jgi:CRP/FNR family transcriptional regulator, cyclic AMP receptor protein
MSVPTLDPAGATRGFIDVRELDLGLWEREAHDRSDLRRRLIARVLHVPAGPLDMSVVGDADDSWLGLLVLDGLLLAQLEEGRGHCGWLLGENDLLRPWDMQEVSLLKRPRWRVLQPARIALLDDEFGRGAGRLPVIAREMLSRSARTAHWLLAKSLLVSCPLVEDRLILLFALLGERWGRVTPDGVLLDLPLTHRLLACLCGARRPTVTLALHVLQEDGVLTRAARGGWLLRRVGLRRPDGRQSCWESYVNALGLT